MSYVLNSYLLTYSRRWPMNYDGTERRELALRVARRIVSLTDMLLLPY